MAPRTFRAKEAARAQRTAPNANGFSSRELNPRGHHRRWAVYRHGQFVGVKFARYLDPCPMRRHGSTSFEVELVANTKAGRAWAGEWSHAK